MLGEWMTPSPDPLPLKGARAYRFFLSPLPVGEGWVRALFFLFPTSPRRLSSSGPRPAGAKGSGSPPSRGRRLDGTGEGLSEGLVASTMPS